MKGHIATEVDIFKGAMPTYVYKFVNTGETIEVQQSFSDDTLTKYKHPETGRMMSVKKVFQPVGVTFKGSGFFKNDNRGSSSTTTPSGTADSGGSSESSSSSKDAGASSDSSSSSGSTNSSSGSKKSESSATKKSAPAAD